MKKLSLLLALVMLLSMGTASISIAADSPTPITITVFQDYTQNIDELPVWQAVEEKFNIDITLNRIVLDDYSSKQTLALTTMDMGDLWLWVGSIDEQNKYGDLGAFVNLLDYSDKLPNMLAAYEKYAKEVESLYSTETGAMYGAFRIYDFPYANEGTLIREDIVEKVGYKVEDIKTVEDLTEVLYAMKAAYPDSTPMQGEWGLSYALNTGLRGNNTGLGIFYDLTKGEYIYGGISEETREVIEWYAQLVKDGIFNPNVDQSGEDFRANLLNSKSFVTYYYGNECAGLNTAGRQSDPDFSMTAMRMPTWDDDGITPLSSWSVHKSHAWLIPSNSKNIDKMIEYIDFMYSEEGSILTTWGIEGETYYVGEDGAKYYMEPIATSYNTGTVSKIEYGLGWSTELVRWFPADAYAGGLDPESKKALECTRADSLPSYNWPSLVWTDEQKEARTNIKTPLDTYATENLAKFMIGERDLSEWDAYVAEAKKMGADELVAMYNERLAEANAK